MVEIKNFDNWIEDVESGKFGSGASEKVWLIPYYDKDKLEDTYSNSKYSIQMIQTV